MLNFQKLLLGNPIIKSFFFSEFPFKPILPYLVSGYFLQISIMPNSIPVGCFESTQPWFVFLLLTYAFVRFHPQTQMKIPPKTLREFGLLLPYGKLSGNAIKKRKKGRKASSNHTTQYCRLRLLRREDCLTDWLTVWLKRFKWVR